MTNTITTSSREILYGCNNYNTHGSKEIINSSSNHLSVGDTADALNNALDNIVKNQKFPDRASLDASGKGRKFDEAQATALNIKVNQTITKEIRSKLTIQKQTMDKINDVMVDFESKMKADGGNHMGTPADKADQALVKIETILRSTYPNGEYIFGGDDPLTDPLSIIDPITGERVYSNIRTQSNVVNGNVLINNFSRSGVNNNTSNISSQHKVNHNFLSAGMDSIIKTVGYLNMIKAGAAEQEIEVSEKDQLKSRNEISIKIAYEIEVTNKADEVNKLDSEENEKILKQFDGDIIELTQNARNLLNSLLAQVSIAAASNKAFDSLINNYK